MSFFVQGKFHKNAFALKFTHPSTHFIEYCHSKDFGSIPLGDVQKLRLHKGEGAIRGNIVQTIQA